MRVYLAAFCVLLMVISAIQVQGFVNVSILRPEGTIIGFVTDCETERPIQGALMTLTYHDMVRTTLTDEQGKYYFTNVPECFCLKNVSANKIGYEGQYKLVAVYDITYVDFSLVPTNDKDEPDEPEEPEDPDEPEDPEDPKDPPEDPDEPDRTPIPTPPKDDEPMEGIITGIVTDSETDLPIADVKMILEYHGTTRTEYTDSEGWYTFYDVPICFCLKNVSAYKRGYKSQSQLVAVSEITYANFSLEPEEITDSESDSGIVSGGTNDMQSCTDSNINYLALSGLLVGLVVSAIGVWIYSIKKKNPK